MTQQRIGQLAKDLGTSTKTLRFYERIGLLDTADRSASGYRLYGDGAANQARLVVGLRRLGLTIEEVDALFHDDDGLSLRQRLLALMDEKLRAAELELSIKQGQRDDLAARCEALLLTPRDRDPDCICEALPTTCTCGRIQKR